MRAVVALVLAVAACASSRSATENDVAMPVARTAEEDQPARLPDAPPEETAEQIIKACIRDVTNGFMVVHVNLQSADSARVKQALAVLDAIATSIERQTRGDEPIFERDFEELVDHVRSEMDDRLKTAPCSLIHAAENTAGRFRHLRGFVPPQARHSPFEEHRLSERTFWCGMQTVNDQVEACHSRYKISGTGFVDLTVRQDGTVTSAVTGGRLGNTPTGDCVAAAARTVTFPRSDGSATSYHFVLK